MKARLKWITPKRRAEQDVALTAEGGAWWAELDVVLMVESSDPTSRHHKIKRAFQVIVQRRYIHYKFVENLGNKIGFNFGNFWCLFLIELYKRKIT